MAAGVGKSMAGMAPKPAPGAGGKPPALADLRAEIDRIDEAMHRLLMERGDIIDRLIAVKKTSETGSAFRPGREAAMMRALAARHAGLLPLDTAEGIWRVIIATFTYVQAPFAVHADVSGGDAPMRDTARFHFGFSVPYRPHESAAAVIAAVAAARGDLGIFRLDQGVSAGAWWRDLVGDRRPKVIARLPFIERPGHPAGTPVFVVSKPLADAAVRDVVLYAASFERWGGTEQSAVAALHCEVIASAGSSRGLSVLLAAPGSVAGGRSADGARRRRPRRDRQPRRAFPREIVTKLGRGFGDNTSSSGPRATRNPPQRLCRHRPCAGDLGPRTMSLPIEVAGTSPAMTARTPRKPMSPRPLPRPGVLEIEAYVPGKSGAPGVAQGPQAVLERDAARAEPAGDRGGAARRRASSNPIPTARRRRCARRSRQSMASIRPGSSAARARTSS